MRSEADLRDSQGADALGFVVASPGSKRNLPPPEAARLAALVPPLVQTVLVTRETEPARLAALHGAVPCDVVQIHGVGDEVLARAVRKALPCKLMLAARIDAPGAEERAAMLAESADAVLLDTGAGGTGRVHDWKLSARIVRALDTPVVLAGGLTPSNVAAAVRAVQPYGVDVSGGVEGARGKSRAKVARFLQEARKHG
jgi:phosphoribosylanthranilate isomerase